ncbi:b(0,+)-type amino acid transporter 1-like [Littorina saxatilis]|uniref:b(0,+)-type amino acid transporter 1 n=1 Tax=Littorina saxatilis TaxID=31220 RepID=A0AAN9GQ64_9CAEN
MDKIKGSHKRYVLGQEPVKEPAVAMTTVAAAQHSKDEGKVEVEVEVDTKGVALLRTLGLTGGCSVIIGTIIGSGIFVSPKGVLQNTGSVALSLVVWILSGGISLLGGLCYSELGTLMGKSGGEYQYLKEAFGDTVGFLYSWTSVMVIRPSSLAIISLTFAEYACAVVNVCGTPLLPVKIAAAAVLVTVGLVNCYSADLAARVQVIFTAAKLGALAVIMIGGVIRLSQGYTSVMETGFEGTTDNAATVSLAFYSALWAYDGWNNLNYVVEELKEPEKNLPRANILGVLVVTGVYAFTNVSYFTVMTPDELLASPAVAVTWGDVVLGVASLLIPLSVMVSTFGAANGTAFSGGRVLYAAARNGDLPDMMSYVHCNKLTPVPSMIFTIFLSLLMIIPGDIAGLIDFFSFTAWLFYGLTFASLILFRYRTKWRHAERAYKVPLVIPVVMVLISLYLLIAPIVDDPRIEFLYAALFVLGGLIFYIPLVHCKVQVKFYDNVSIFVQLFLQVVPTKAED